MDLLLIAGYHKSVSIVKLLEVSLYSRYTAGMKKALMKEMRWNKLPHGATRTSRSTTVPVKAGTLRDDSSAGNLRMLAVSDEDFVFSCSSDVLQVGPDIARCGVCVHQDPNDWLWTSAWIADDGKLHVHARLCTRGSADSCTWTLEPHQGPNVRWELQRMGMSMRLCVAQADGPALFLRDFSFPSMGKSVSFGCCCANSDLPSMVVSFSELAYTCTSSDSPLKESTATTALL